MTDSAPTPNPPAGASGAYRDAFDTALTAIEPFAVMQESRHFEPSVAELVLDPLKARRDVDTEATLTAPPDEAADFAGLAAALDAFAAAVSAITFDAALHNDTARVRDTTAALAAMAHTHADSRDATEPSNDKHAAKEFYKAVDRWEDATADLAGKLGL